MEILMHQIIIPTLGFKKMNSLSSTNHLKIQFVAEALKEAEEIYKRENYVPPAKTDSDVAMVPASVGDAEEEAISEADGKARKRSTPRPRRS